MQDRVLTPKVGNLISFLVSTGSYFVTVVDPAVVGLDDVSGSTMSWIYVVKVMVKVMHWYSFICYRTHSYLWASTIYFHATLHVLMFQEHLCTNEGLTPFCRILSIHPCICLYWIGPNFAQFRQIVERSLEGLATAAKILVNNEFSLRHRYIRISVITSNKPE